MLRRLRVVLMILLLAPVAGLAQENKIPVAVSYTGDDQVGQHFAFTLKETIRGSQSFRLVDDEAAPTSARIVVHLVSQEFSERKGVVSAISQSIVYDQAAVAARGIFLTSLVQICGRDRIEFCAKNTLPAIDQGVETLRKNWSHLWKALTGKN